MRHTRVRESIIRLFDRSTYPLSAEDLQKHISANKTTIYRQLESLVQNKVINEVRFSDRKVRYEPANRVHHHHLVCDSCGSVKDIPLNETVLLSQLKDVKDFNITRHSLEFFGTCSHCLNT